MSFERKDLIPTAIALFALGAQVGGFVNAAAGWTVLVAAFAMLVAFFVMRESATTSFEVPGPTPEEAEKARRQALLVRLQGKYEESNGVYEAYVTASSDAELTAAKDMLEAWGQSTAAVVAEGFSVGKANAFAHLGNMPIMWVTNVSHPRKSGYKWAQKEAQMVRINEYQKRLVGLMGEL